ncbi:uncharacterized protein A4U43_C04F19920 [Asparagus officinalis]|uniref:RING-type domain-containing protein n=1 Tax=Asparagus officinalis TaxID=4686 RepID=A0A5P1F2B4_ASPOF|nr:uncharacterized protein A4U43_C04F19920 [Asparagus officinalis]
MAAAWLGYDLHFNLEQNEGGFRMMANGDYRNIRLHAFGDRFRFASIDQNNLPPQAQIGIFIVNDRNWLPNNALLSIESGEMDADEPTFDMSSMHGLGSLRDPIHSRRIIRQKLSQLEITGSNYREDYVNFIGHFVYRAARVGYEYNCQGVVVVIEVNYPRALDGNALPLMQVLDFGGEGVEIRGDGCIICWENFHLGRRVAVLGCSHAYHEECIQEWFRRSPTCPLCRS